MALELTQARVRLQVERQIDQMVRFIKQEAEEKANEIKVSSEEVQLLCCCSTASSRLVLIQPSLQRCI